MHSVEKVLPTTYVIMYVFKEMGDDNNLLPKTDLFVSTYFNINSI